MLKPAKAPDPSKENHDERSLTGPWWIFILCFLCGKIGMIM
jgi:hypothetical protein